MATTDTNMITFFGRVPGLPALTGRELTNIRDSITAGRSLVDDDGDPRAATNDDVVTSLYQHMTNNTLGYLIQSDPSKPTLSDVRVAPTP